MKIDILFVDVLVFALVAVPYALFIYMGQKKSRDLKKKFKQEIAQHQMKPGVVGKWNLNMIGLDLEKKEMLFVQGRHDKYVVKHLNLNNCRSCNVEKKYVNSNSDGSKEEILESIQLKMDCRNGFQYLPLYSEEQVSQQDFEEKNAQEWSSRINEMIKAGQQKVAAVA